MSASKKAKPVSPVPTPDTFSLQDFIVGVSTFPTFSHTVYLDQAGGVELLRLSEEYDALARRGRDIQARQALMNEHPSTVGLVDDDFDALSDELADITAKTDDLAEQISAAEAKVMKSALTLTFQVAAPHKQGQVVQQANKEYDRLHGRKNDDDLEYVTAKGKFRMAAQMAEFCIRITVADGREIPVPDAAGFEGLLDRLISSESMRLITALGAGLDSSAAWAERLDAGFPGGGADVADEPVGDSGAEGGEELGDAAADDAGGQEDLVA